MSIEDHPPHWSYTGITMSKAWKSGSTASWRRVRYTVLTRDRFLCQINGPRCTNTATTADHVRCKADGGTDEPSNLRASCGPCNFGRRDTITDPKPEKKWIQW